jgi:hypothetical protein
MGQTGDLGAILFDEMASFGRGRADRDLISKNNYNIIKLLNRVTTN